MSDLPSGAGDCLVAVVFGTLGLLAGVIAIVGAIGDAAGVW